MNVESNCFEDCILGTNFQENQETYFQLGSCFCVSFLLKPFIFLNYVASLWLFLNLGLLYMTMILGDLTLCPRGEYFFSFPNAVRLHCLSKFFQEKSRNTNSRFHYNVLKWRIYFSMQPSYVDSLFCYSILMTKLITSFSLWTPKLCLCISFPFHPMMTATSQCPDILLDLSLLKGILCIREKVKGLLIFCNFLRDRRSHYLVTY